MKIEKLLRLEMIKKSPEAQARILFSINWLLAYILMCIFLIPAIVYILYILN